MYESLTRSYRERDQPYIQWDYSSFGVESHGVCRIGTFRLNEEWEMERQLYGNDLFPAGRGDPLVSTVTVAQCKHALRKIVRDGGQIRIFFGQMPDAEIEKFLNVFQDAEVVIND